MQELIMQLKPFLVKLQAHATFLRASYASALLDVDNTPPFLPVHITAPTGRFVVSA